MEGDGINCLVDWKSEEDYDHRAFLFRAYRAFLQELRDTCKDCPTIEYMFTKWKVENLDIDDFPRISIEYPKDYPEALK